MDRTLAIVNRMSRVFALLLVVALAVRFALPAGTMLAKSDEDGALPTIVICTSTGMIEVAADGDYGVPGKAPDKHDDGKPGEPCVFAGVGTVAVVPAFDYDEAAIPSLAAALPWISAWQRPGLGLSAPPPPATGPPARI